MSYFNETAITVANSPAIDAFGRFRVSNPVSLFDSKQTVVNDGEVWDNEFLNGSETFAPTTASTTLSVDAGSGNYAIRQTYQRMNYIPAKSQFVFLTASTFAPQTDVIKRIGYFNSNFNAPFTAELDGLYFQSSGGAVSVNVGNLGVIETAAQGSWNVDNLDGTGPSGKTVTNWNLNMIYVMDFEWLGVGTVRFGVVIDGAIIYIHKFHHSNLTTGVYMSSPNHSCRYELQSTGGAGSLEHICCSVQSEGGEDPRFKERVIDNGLTAVAGPNKDLEWALCGVRLASGVINAAGININLQSIGVMTTTANANGGWSVQRSPVVQGSPTWLPVPLASGVEYFIGDATNLIPTQGLKIHNGYYTNNIGVSTVAQTIPPRIGIGISGVSQTIVLTNFNTVNAAAMFGSMDLEIIS